jgi:hypothetical protein
MRMLVRIVRSMETNTSGKVVTVYTRGCDLSAVTEGLKDMWRLQYRFSAMQVWTWRGGEAIVCHDWDANYGRGEYRVIVRTGGLTKGTIRVLYANCFSDAMQQLGISFRHPAIRQRRERTASQLHRAALARAARVAGNHFRTLRARPARETMARQVQS